MSRGSEGVKELFAPKPVENLSRDQKVKKKLQNIGAVGETLISESFKLSNASLVEERLKERIFSAPQDIAEVNIHGEVLEEPRDTRMIKIKLLFVDIGETNALIHTFLKITGLIPKWGRIHTALAVGGKIVEWNDSSLCFPRDCTSSRAILAVDICTLQGENIDGAIKALSEVIAKWNVDKEYGVIQANCQVFVDECLKVMKIRTDNFSSILNQYIADVRNTGHCEVYVRLTEELKKEFTEKGIDVKEGKIEFESHVQLDNFCWQIMDKFEEDFSDAEKILPHHHELAVLLKAFDRGYWLRNRKGDVTQKKCDRGCPFKDPVLTGTAWAPTTRQSKVNLSNVSANSSATGNIKQQPKEGGCLLQ
jgi:hypothetical protein